MSFALLAPLGLFALAALALPIVIHLVRRIELRTTDFAALRWISERIRPRRRLRFERPWLLLLRLALLALFALLLARPVVDEPAIAARALVVVAPGSDLSAARSVVSIADANWRWLAPGFPSIETPAPSTPEGRDPSPLTCSQVIGLSSVSIHTEAGLSWRANFPTSAAAKGTIAESSPRGKPVAAPRAVASA